MSGIVQIFKNTVWQSILYSLNELSFSYCTWISKNSTKKLAFISFNLIELLQLLKRNNSVKSVRIRSFFWSVFSSIQTRKTPNTDTFYPMNLTSLMKLHLTSLFNCMLHIFVTFHFFNQVALLDLFKFSKKKIREARNNPLVLVELDHLTLDFLTKILSQNKQTTKQHLV